MRAGERARAALWVAVALLAAGCGNADAAQPSPELVEHAAPLVEAHRALEAHAELVGADAAAAAVDWPEVEARVAAAVDGVPDPDGLDLEPRERSALVGYTRGLDVALGGWADAHAALAAGDADGARRAADRARESMRPLERLRAGVTP